MAFQRTFIAAFAKASGSSLQTVSPIAGLQVSRISTRAVTAARSQGRAISSLAPYRKAALQPNSSPRGTRFASSVGGASATDPRDAEADQFLKKGVQAMADSDLEGAKDAFQRSIDVKATPAGLYNLALTLYQIGELEKCVAAFEESIALQPSADAHTNVASAYILSTPPNAQKAIEHLQKALQLAPDDGEINFNMGVIFEASERLEDALREYNRAQELGIDRAAQCIRNVGGKILEKKRGSLSPDDIASPEVSKQS